MAMPKMAASTVARTTRRSVEDAAAPSNPDDLDTLDVGSEVALQRKALANTHEPVPVPQVPGLVQIHVLDALGHEVVTVFGDAFTEIIERVPGVDHQYVEKEGGGEQNAQRGSKPFDDKFQHCNYLPFRLDPPS